MCCVSLIRVCHLIIVECYVLVTFVRPSVTQIANMLTKLGQW